MSEQTPETTDLTTQGTTALSTGAENALALLMQAEESLEQVYDQMTAMSENNMGGAGAGSSGYDFTGKVKVEVQRNGTLVFQNPFTGKIDGGNSISIVPISVKFQLQRWFGEKEEIEGIDKEKQKGPLCRSVMFEEPVPTRNAETGEMENAINETGWFHQPAMSAYNARRMLPTLTGNHGCDGKSGMTLCADCPMAVQGYKGNEQGGKCGPIGMVECVIFQVNDEFLPQPVYAYVKMSVTSIIEYVEFLKQIKKVHKDPRTGKELQSPVMRLILKLTCESQTSGAKSWGKLNYHAFGAVNPSTEQGQNITKTMATAIELTTAKLAEIAEKDASKANNKGNAGGGGTTQVAKAGAPF
jgi:hypothetical protein